MISSTETAMNSLPWLPVPIVEKLRMRRAVTVCLRHFTMCGLSSNLPGATMWRNDWGRGAVSASNP